MAITKSNQTVVILGLWQPVHIGHQAALYALCKQFTNVNIGIGSSNIHNYRNPFTLHEVTDMLALTLENFKNFSLTPGPDLLDPQKWCESVISKFSQPEIFVTANPYVKQLLGGIYPIKHPVNFIPEGEKRKVSATMVRKRMAHGKKRLLKNGIPGFCAALLEKLVIMLTNNGRKLLEKRRFSTSKTNNAQLIMRWD